MRLLRTSVAVGLGAALFAWWVPTSYAAPADAADLRVDSNRDGRVDVTGDSDQRGEEQATPTSGALFLPNVDDDARRCAATGPHECNDAADEVVNGAEDAEDLARIRSVPLRGATGTGSVAVTGPGAAHTHLFLRRGEAWQLVTPTTTLVAADLRDGVELGIEGTDVVRDTALWDGRATITLTVTTDGRTTTDSVTMRAAPVLTHTHLQRAQQVLVTRSTRNPEPSKKFVADLRAASTAAGLTEPVFEFTEHGDDEWAQDFLEPMYVNMPVGRSVQSMRVLFRSHQASRDAGEELYRLRGPGVGVVQLAGDSDTQDPMGTLDSMGNLETIPPYSHNGHNYPAGRVIMGHNAGKGYEPSTAVRTFLTSQGMQSPIFIDTSWTIVSHVDEFVQFLPANTPRGWRMAVADPDGAMKVLRDAKATGHGDVRLSSDPGSASKRTIGDYLDSKKATLARINTWAATNIAKTVAALKQEIGLRDDEIIRVPVLFSSAELTFEDDDPAPTTPQLAPGKQTPPSKLATPGDSVMPDKKVTRDNGAASGTQLAARPGAAPQDEPYDYPLFTRLPAAINGVVLAPRRYVAARQWGPVIGRVDIFEKAVTAAYRRAGMSVTFIDDRFLAGGDVHCGTNTLRETTARWWV